MKRSTIIAIISFLLIMLFVYTGADKYLDYVNFQRAMHKQHFPLWLEQGTIWLLPPVEIITGILLMNDKTRFTGLLMSMTLLFVFTVYILGILLHLFARTPCPCGGVIRTFRWPEHLIFNCFFLVVNTWAVILYKTNQTSQTAAGEKPSA